MVGCLFPDNTDPCDDGATDTRDDACSDGVCVGIPFSCASLEDWSGGDISLADCSSDSVEQCIGTFDDPGPAKLVWTAGVTGGFDCMYSSGGEFAVGAGGYSSTPFSIWATNPYSWSRAKATSSGSPRK